ncbi:MAG TPA: hypothetical protein VFY28_03200 [Candidatus Paceibacterota bacterium]|nr:hypothetical protein [Candidatus Paceibacterota bacterium]
MSRTITLFVAIAIVAAVGIWLGVRADQSYAALPKLSRPQAAAVALLPVEGRFDETGIIAMDQGTNTYNVAYIVYTVERGGGTQGIATKRLIFPSAYACQAGDVPCAGPIGNASPVSPGQEVRVIGTLVNESVRVERIELRP